MILPLIFGLTRATPLLEHFFRFYSERGVSLFACLLHDESQRPVLKEYLSGYPYVIQSERSEQPFCGRADAEGQDWLRNELVAPDGCYLTADADEFHYVPEFASFPDLAREMNGQGSDYVPSVLVDRVTENGLIPAALDEFQSLDGQFPLAAAVTLMIVQGRTSKVVMARGNVKIASGHHWAEGLPLVLPQPCETHHFKWWGGDLIARQAARERSYLQQGLCWHLESSRLLQHLALHGRINVGDPSLCARGCAIGV